MLVDLAKKHNITVTGTYMITGDYMETNADTLHRIVQDSYENTRSEFGKGGFAVLRNFTRQENAGSI